MLLQCRNLGFQYPGSSVQVINNLSFTLEGPGLYAAFGPSGVGKTSFARILAGQLAPNQGEVISNALHTILYSYNLERLPGWASVGKILRQVTPTPKQELLDELIDLFQVGHLLGNRFAQLSLGQQNRINLLRYLVQEFDLLILDESLANVDEKLRQEILLHIKALFSEKIFLSISHNLLEVAKFCKEILVLGAGPTTAGNTHLLRGLDLQGEGLANKEELDTIMLEIMNAC